MEAMPARLTITSEQALGFRLSRHHLDERLAASKLEAAVAACGLQDTPPGMAVVALQARVKGLHGGELAARFGRKGTLAKTWSLRGGAPYVVARSSFAAFTRGVAPRDEAGVRSFLGQQSLICARDAGLDPAEALNLVAAAIAKSLKGRVLSKHHLGGALKRLLPEPLWPWCRGCQAKHVPFSLVRSAGVRAEICLPGHDVDGEEGEVVALARDWFAGPIAEKPEASRRALVSKFLGCYAPATPQALAEWTGLSASSAKILWDSVAPQLATVDFLDRPAWVLAEDLPALRKARPPDGLRLLPAQDAYLHQPRPMLLVDTRHHPQVWRMIGKPGVILQDGRIAGIWRSVKKGARRDVTLTAFATLAGAAKKAAESEAREVARIQGEPDARVGWS
jgi:hypothetical protein